MSRALLLSAVTALIAACGEQEPPRAGGATTIDNRTSLAFAQPAPNLSTEGLAHHRAGDAAFAAIFVPGPAPVNPGLGPLFNNNSCNACHLRNGRGMPVMGSGPQRTQLLVRVSMPEGVPTHPNGPVPVPGLGIQIADQANYGLTPEASVLLEWVESEGTYGDGTRYGLREPRIRITPNDGSALPAGMLTSLRLPPPVFGLGLLEAVEDSTLKALADPKDKNKDGISGRLNEVWDVQAQALVPGRFGLKANSPTLLQQSAEAYLNDMGLTTPLFPEPDGSHELPLQTLEAAVFYARTLGVPARTFLDNAETQRGEEQFQSLGCERCHRETLQTGPHALAELSHQRIHPYTDLLLHDMGAGLADGRPDGAADGQEWRTAPLWGLGLTQTVLPYSGYLHDGRARTLEEAILWHGGEAERSREQFRKLPVSDRNALVKFLGSL
ncbi:di-heme oxidoredictase family protein [Stigmatella sp. ncwal1]|uniref:Di-heme oxidoredictase family protein n=1 Tax=Stigmatella ashevillensis TaxID=2995309 RepID=A0ABT5DRJ2_9BACT|nr:di-heme oxidoredictase family protein [Stigmatella ashevillena]MDC0715022.1 di-heme oxidoredictase family protein [Stigmatella ashevillena]